MYTLTENDQEKTQIQCKPNQTGRSSDADQRRCLFVFSFSSSRVEVQSRSRDPPHHWPCPSPISRSLPFLLTARYGGQYARGHHRE